MLIRIVSYLIIFTIIVAIYNLFSIKAEVSSLRDQLNIISKQITIENNTIHILKAELAYLTSPARLQRLTSNYLDLSIIKTNQMIQDPLMLDNKNYVKSTESFKTDFSEDNVKLRYKKIPNNKYIQTISSRK